MEYAIDNQVFYPIMKWARLKQHDYSNLDQDFVQVDAVQSSGTYVARVASAASALMMGCLVLGVVLGKALLPLRNSAEPGGVFNHLLAWDGRIYFSVMRNGYSWDPVHGMLPHHYQSIEFFPLAPILDWIVQSPFPAGYHAPVIVLSLALGIASVFAFARLAAEVEPGEGALWATILFATWPASAFYIMGYPTGLISVLIVLALSDHIKQKYWRSALWCGIATALAPTIVFIVTALGIDRARRWVTAGGRFDAIPGLVGWGVLCIAGILGFMSYQWVHFGDPFAFSKAAEAWGSAPPLAGRLHRLVDVHWYLQQWGAARREIARGLLAFHHGGGAVAAMSSIEEGVQRRINLIAMVFAVTGLTAATLRLRGHASIVSLSGWIVLAGYAWFIFSTDQNMLAVPRLMLPAMGIFLGLGWLVSRLGRVAAAIVCVLFCLVTVSEAAFAVGGYWLV